MNGADAAVGCVSSYHNSKAFLESIGKARSVLPPAPSRDVSLPEQRGGTKAVQLYHKREEGKHAPNTILTERRTCVTINSAFFSGQAPKEDVIMQMPVQFSLDELLSMLMARMDSLAVAEENMKTKFNIFARVLYKKGLLTDEEILESVREEHRVLKELGLLAEMPGEDMLKAVADNMLQWIKGDVKAIKKGMEEYEKKLREYAAQEARKPKIDVAPSNVLSQLDRLSGKKPGGGKLIL